MGTPRGFIGLVLAPVGVAAAGLRLTAAGASVVAGLAVAAAGSAATIDPRALYDEWRIPMRGWASGSGYRGATHAVGMAVLGYDVMGFDIDPGKVTNSRMRAIAGYCAGIWNAAGPHYPNRQLEFTDHSPG